jgi:hypothetical protein
MGRCLGGDPLMTTGLGWTVWLVSLSDGADVSGVPIAKNGTGFAGRMVGLKAGPSFSADGRHGRLSNAAYPFCTSPHLLLVWPPWGRALGTAELGSATLCPVFLSTQPNPNPTNQPRAELRAIDFCLLFPSISVPVSPTKHHQNPRRIHRVYRRVVRPSRLLDPATIHSPCPPRASPAN